MTSTFITSNEKRFVDGYLTNINKHYNFKDTECEMRAGQSLGKFGGDSNRINLAQFRKLINYYDKLSETKDSDQLSVKRLTPSGSNSISLDIGIQHNHNLNLGIKQLRFSLKGQHTIMNYCSTNKIPKLSEWKKQNRSANDYINSVEMIYKDSLKWNLNTEEDKLNYSEMANLGYKTTNDNSNIDVESIRTRLGGKVELSYDFKTNQFSPSDISNEYLANLKLKASEVYKSFKQNDYALLDKTFRLKDRISFSIKFNGEEFRVDLTKIKHSKTDYNDRMIPVKLFTDSEINEQEPVYEYEIEFNPQKDSSILLQFINEIFIPSMEEIQICPSFTPKNIQDDVIKLYKDLIMKMLSDRIRSKVNILGDINIYKGLLKEDSESAKTKLNELNKKYDKFSFYHLVKDDSIEKLQQISNDYQKKLQNIRDRKGEYSSNKDLFISPKVLSIELNNVREESPVSICSNYTVSDKADGYSMILVQFGPKTIIGKDNTFYQNKMFMIDSNLNVYNTNITAIANSGSYIFNGEYLPTDINKKMLHKYGVFDCYLFDGVDVSHLPLMTSNPAIESRYSKFKSYFDNKNYVHTNNDKHNFDIFPKRFLLADQTTSIFNQSLSIWNDYLAKIPNKAINALYYLDGLIYTPAHYPVGYNPNNPDYDLKQNTTWTYNMKWKPSEDNTIDFLIRFETVDIARKGNKTIKKHKVKRVATTEGGETSYKEYIIGKLYNGGTRVTKTNPCFKRYTKTRSDVLIPIMFEPSQPMVENIETILLPITQDLNTGKSVILDLEGNPIDDDTIVEVSYTKHDNTKPDYEPNPNLRWSVLRTRHDKSLQYKLGLQYQKRSYMQLQKCLNLSTKDEQMLQERDLNLMEKNKYLIENIPDIKRFTKGRNTRAIVLFKKFKHTIEEHYSSSLDFRANINFGNHSSVAKNIWRTIHTPVTTEMIVSGNGIPDLSQEEEKYYNTSKNVRAREKSITIDMQNFHNKIIKNKILLKTVTQLLKNRGSSKISLLDLACGKGGDIAKWRDNNVTDCVGIDYMHNNIDDYHDGACARYQFYREQARNQNRSIPNVHFLVGDVGKSFEDGSAITDKRYALLYNNLWNAHDKFNTHYNKNKFDVISVMFATHYFFKSTTILDNFISNISNNLKNGGYLIGCCFDGKQIFKQLSKIPYNGHKEIYKNGTLMWKILKQYKDLEFKDDESSVGLPIKVYISSINQMIEEYLVNFEILKKKLAEKNIVPLSDDELKQIEFPRTPGASIGNFKNIYTFIKDAPDSSAYHKIAESIQLSSEERELSFLFKYFIFKRKTDDENVLDDVVQLILTNSSLSKMIANKRNHLKIQTMLDKTYSADIVTNAIAIAFKRSNEEKKSASKKLVLTKDVVETSESDPVATEQPAEDMVMTKEDKVSEESKDTTSVSDVSSVDEKSSTDSKSDGVSDVKTTTDDASKETVKSKTKDKQKTKKIGIKIKLKKTVPRSGSKQVDIKHLKAEQALVNHYEQFKLRISPSNPNYDSLRNELIRRIDVLLKDFSSTKLESIRSKLSI